MKGDVASDPALQVGDAQIGINAHHNDRRDWSMIGGTVRTEEGLDNYAQAHEVTALQHFPIVHLLTRPW